MEAFLPFEQLYHIFQPNNLMRKNYHMNTWTRRYCYEILSDGNPLSGDPTKVKHIQTIRRQPTSCLSVFDHFVGLALEGLICE